LEPESIQLPEFPDHLSLKFPGLDEYKSFVRVVGSEVCGFAVLGYWETGLYGFGSSNFDPTINFRFLFCQLSVAVR
jgi:hypothetical protein